MLRSLLFYCLALMLAPLLPGIVNRTKALFAGRRGPSLFQLYYDLWKLLRKGAVYSKTTTWVFRAGPMLGLAAVLAALTFVPLGRQPALVSFSGDFLLLAYFLGVMRFATVLAALDTGSSFEGMGASREMQFAALAEPAFLLGLAAMARRTSCLSLSEMLGGISVLWPVAAPVILHVAAAWMIVFLAENSRIPFDDPNTHLELTMIHEVMVLDHGGVDLAYILYGAALKLWVLGALLVGLLLPVSTGSPWMDCAIALGGLVVLAVLTGVIESTMARLRLLRVPQILVGAGLLSVMALVFVLR